MDLGLGGRGFRVQGSGFRVYCAGRRALRRGAVLGRRFSRLASGFSTGRGYDRRLVLCLVDWTCDAPAAACRSGALSGSLDVGLDSMLAIDRQTRAMAGTGRERLGFCRCAGNRRRPRLAQWENARISHSRPVGQFVSERAGAGRSWRWRQDFSPSELSVDRGGPRFLRCARTAGRASQKSCRRPSDRCARPRRLCGEFPRPASLRPRE